MKRHDPARGRRSAELAALAFFLLLTLIFFAPVLFGGATLLPFDNLYRFPPWQSFASAFGVGPPHNPLLDDLVLENYPWKKFILDSLRAGELPLWNPYLLAGQPFMAAGQNAALYLPGVLFLLLPLTRAYGVFVALHFWIAAASMYWLGRALGLRPLAAALGAVVYAFSMFMVVSVVFPMVISAACWLPAILAALELTLREEGRRRPRDPGARYSPRRQLLFALLTIILLGIQFLAGHVEISYYILMVVALYAVWRAATLLAPIGTWRERVRQGLRLALMLILMVGLGTALAAAQLVPLYELVQRNFREGSASFQQVADWALPLRQVFTFVIPDFFGNPAHHAYLDVFDWTTKPAPNGTIFWGIKNYVEAGAYIGILPLALALVAVGSAAAFYQGRRTATAESPAGRDGGRETEADLAWLVTLPHSHILFFAVLALLALLFAFGTPLYAVLFYLLPGYNQLHTAFRWIFPWTLSMAFLAAAGAEALSRHDWKAALNRGGGAKGIFRKGLFSWLVAALAWLMLAGGALVLAALAASLLWPAPFLRMADWVVAHDLARPVFGAGRVFWSYEFRPLLLFGVFVLGAGVVLRLARSTARLPKRLGSWPLWQPLALLLAVLDLFLAGAGFNPAVDARLADFTPPAIRFLQSDPSLFRVASYDLPGQKAVNPATGVEEDRPPERILNPNAGMYFGLSDVRGYDSIIVKRYAELMGALAPQDELLYNRIAPFYNYQALSSPLLNLLNVKYVLSTRALPNPGYRLVYDREIKIYENLKVLPRAFMLGRARVISNDADLLKALPSLDPGREVLLEAPAPLPGGGSESSFATPVIEKYSGGEVLVQTHSPQAGYLVLADTYFPGWIAQIDGQDTSLYRADYDFRAVVVPAGDHTVRFKYSPLSLKVGGVASLVAGVLVLLGFIALGWQQFFGLQLTGEGAQVRVIAKNSLVPMVGSFINQGLSFALALVLLRVLGPANAGRYAFAGVVLLFTASITDFGLGLLVTREVSRDRSQANRYLTNSALLRTALTFLAIIPLGLILYLYVRFAGPLGWDPLTPETVLTILLLWVGLIPTNLAASLSFLFNAYERFEYPTAVTLGTVLLSVTLQLAALLGGLGIVGLAAVSIISNLFTLTALFCFVRTVLFRPSWEPDGKLLRWMFFESYPLMFNNVLSSLFFRIDVFLLKPLAGDLVLGYYSTAYRFINALNFIPSNFTLAIFPLLSRYAASAKDAMSRALLVSLKLLLWVALPITVASVFIARELILLFGGAAYLPDSAVALQWLIWFLPFSFVNSVVHYVLIALNQQRFLTKAFLIGLGFNLAANLTAIPLLSYRGAALVTVLSEIALLIPFYYSLRRHLAPLPVLDLLWRPSAAAGIMAGALYLLLPRLPFIPALALSGLVYGVVLLALGALGPDEWLLLRQLAPQRLTRVLDFVSRSPAQ